MEKFHVLIDRTWDQHVRGEMLSDLDLIDLQELCKSAAGRAVSGAQVIYRFLGMGAIMESTDLNRIYRDLHAASQHKLLV
ncbi:hypothetical protein [Piscibacillus salipiscarius]|uniref:hypothetical protein n=1 Tax=Piscibacillus salipiscarius TaxID=299480 RepID=UPI002436C67E|nr:hypothetical protein [Piscibacillus salipiscarius]